MPAVRRSRENGVAAVRREMRRLAEPRKAELLGRFFRTGKGEYGEGDVFLGVMVPDSRLVARRHADLPLSGVARLLRSRWHEERLVALLILVERFRRGDAKTRAGVYRFYLANAERANNWDLVDLSAHKIVGEHLAAGGAPASILDRLAASPSLWRRRIAIVATFAFIARGVLGHSFRIADRLRQDPHDLIHKATGWMLREVGKRDKAALVRFLAPRYALLPRTTLRYAIERFSARERRAYLEGRA